MAKANDSKKIKCIVSYRADKVEVEGKKGVKPPVYVGAQITVDGRKIIQNWYVPVDTEVEIYEEVANNLKNRKYPDYDSKGNKIMKPMFFVEEIK